MELEDLLEEYGALSLEKQDALSDFLGERNWLVDLPTGTVDFGQGRTYRIELIGSESRPDGSWLWAWANKFSPIPAGLLQAVATIRQFGQQHGVRAFVEPKLGLETLDSHIFGLVASGIADADAYYLGHHEDGAVLFLIMESGLKQLLKPSVLRMNTIFMTLISNWAIRNQERAFVSYARAKGCQIEAEGGRIKCRNPVGEEMQADFADRRLVHMSFTLGPGKISA